MINLRKIPTRFINYKAGNADQMFIDNRQLTLSPGQLLFKVRSIGINRAECLHRQGKYKINRPIQGFLGLEASGEVIDPETNKKIYDGMALLTGGSYAQWATIPASHVMPIPQGINYAQASGIPQAWITAFQLLTLANVKEGDHVVIYAGASGVGTAAIQLVRLLKAHPYAVVSTEQKGKICKQLGVEEVVYYRNNPNWGKELMEKRKGSFDVVLDCVGPDNVDSTLQLLGLDGRWILFGLLSGAKTNINMALLLGKRINLISTTLKTRSDEYKSQLIEKFKKTTMEAFEDKRLRPIITERFICDWKSPEAFVKAHQMMESNANVGKIIIEFS